MTTLMIQGTSSSVGKSLLVAALCRSFARRGVRVAPFKAQNMSNNAAVCGDGAEIGRAQALQAVAAGIAPTADLNPVLLKPEADARAQVILQGRPWKTLPARGYYQEREHLWPIITAALDRLRRQYELVLIEGAGSPVELNLRQGDMVNMALARHAQSPVLLVGDIDRGGVFAQLLGTLWLLDDAERRLVRGLVVNKFRGDRTLFADGVRILEERGGLPVVGVLPFLKDLQLPEEDAVALEGSSTLHAGGYTPGSPVELLQLPEEDAVALEGSSTLHAGVYTPGAPVDVVVIRLPRIANFDDFDPLLAEPGVRLRYVTSIAELGRPAAVILPGTKSTCADLAWLREQGLAEAIGRLAAEGAGIVGICGGYQMLGKLIRDPDQVEASERVMPGLGLLPIETTFVPAKATCQVKARVLPSIGWLPSGGLEGYEIHMGRSTSPRPWLQIVERNGVGCAEADGGISDDGRVWGCYLHGLFGNEAFRHAWLGSLGVAGVGGQTTLERSLDRLADMVDEHLDRGLLEQILGEARFS